MHNKIFKQLILSNLIQDINNNYVLLGLPKHMNIGDTLIWEAETQLLTNINYKCLNQYFWGYTNINIDTNTLIIFSGGGSWDDIWETINYIEQILEKFPNNDFLFLPNSVWYDNINRSKQTISILNNHIGKIILYNREQQSYDLACKLFPMIINRLVPDVVLGWDIKSYITTNDINSKTNKILFISRNDIEKTNILNFKYNDITDWPQLINKPKYIKDINCNDYKKQIVPNLIKDSIEFINKYDIVYSDRMHGALLSWLLGKETYLINNSYGKSKSLYDTWLKNTQINML